MSRSFQGPAVLVVTKSFVDRMHGPRSLFSRFARAQLSAAGHIPAQQKIAQLQRLGARIYVCGPSMANFKVRPSDITFDGVIVAEYLTFMEVRTKSDIYLYA